MSNKRVVLAGGTGFLGHLLGEHLSARGYDIVILTRNPSPGRFKEVAWDARTPGDWIAELDGAAAVLNLAGRSVNCRFTPDNKRAIMDSRVNSTQAIGDAIARCGTPPAAWLNASTATIYRHTFGPPHNEQSTDFAPTPEVKDAYSVQVARQWEKVLAEAATPVQTRKVALRITIVFGTVEGGVFQIMRRLSRLGAAGPMAGGQQYVSWIHERDFCDAVQWILDHPELSGPVNLGSPNPVTNAEMMREFRKACGIPISIPATRWMLEIGAAVMRTETELLLKSRYVVPGKLLASGFQFRFPRMSDALVDLERQARSRH